jgi:hypothetical protein
MAYFGPERPVEFGLEWVAVFAGKRNIPPSARHLRPGHDHAGIVVDYDRKVELALPSTDVVDLHLVGVVYRELTQHMIRRDYGRFACNPTWGLVATYNNYLLPANGAFDPVEPATLTRLRQITEFPPSSINAWLAVYELRMRSSKRSSSMEHSETGSYNHC